jgi:hypothetical protein
LGRFLQVDPLAHATHSQTPYHYASNNPFNDPTGLLSDGEFAGIVQDLLNSKRGGTWTEAGGTHKFDASEASAWLAANEKRLRKGGGGASNGGVSQSTHLKGVHGKGLGNLPGHWNKLWSDFIKANPIATPSEIFHHAEGLLKKFGLEHLPYVPY